MFTYSLYLTRSGTDSGAPATSGVAASGTNTYYSESLKGSDDFSVGVATSGTLTGTWTLWGSNKMDPNTASDTDWTDLTALITPTNPAGAATKWTINSVNTRMRRVRLKYVNASGTGTLTADANHGNRR